MNTGDALWASARARALLRARDLGGMIRFARQAREWRQDDLAGASGYSRSTISRLETGARAGTDVEMTLRVAAAVGIPSQLLSELLGITAPPAATVGLSIATRAEGGDDPVRRRELLAGLAGVSAATLLPASQAAAGTNPGPVTTALAEVLTSDSAAAAPVSSAALRAHLAAAWRAFNSCRYQELAGQLPGLVAAASASRAQSTGAARAAGAQSLADAYVLVSELAAKAGEDGVSWVAADRALAAAKDSGAPATIAAASRAVAIAMRRMGHYDTASRLLTGTALSLGADRGNPPAPVLAAYGSLLCTAAYTSARNGRRHQALDLIAEARSAATRMGSTAAVSQPMFSMTGVQVYQIGIHTALGDSAAALGSARSVIQSELPTAERQARFCIDTARAWQQHGRPDQAYQALLAAERHAPEEIRRTSVRTLITTMAQGPGAKPHGLRQLAVRAGAPA